MQIMTKYFFSIDYHEEEVISFENGIFGFEDYKKFILIPFDRDNNNICCLQSIEEQTLAFILINICNFLPSYKEEILYSIPNSFSNDSLSIYGICVISEIISQSTANLKCPLFINSSKTKGIQIILENSTYPFKYPFSTLMTVGEDETC